MHNDLLTVILSTYNHKSTFKQAIESVLSQKTGFNFKILILDDASNDGTSDIVREYASKYPEKITAFINQVNCKGLWLREQLKKIDTKYYTILETDDYWTDDNKLQMQVDILEKNPDCSMCAHNTTRNYIELERQEPYLFAKEGKYSLPEKKLTHEFYIEPHTSSRIYRTSCINIEEVADTDIIVYDVCTVFYFLTKGNMYYIDKVMSVYNYTGKGLFSSSSSYRNRFRAASGIFRLNKQLGYKYNYLLARFFATRLNLNFVESNRLKKCRSNEKLESMYSKILNDFEKQYFSFVERKPIINFKVPVSTKKKLCIEICREKNIC